MKYTNCFFDLPDRIRNYKAGQSEDQTEYRASVLIPLVEKDGEWSILFEQRATRLDVQPGEFCFPGGGIEEGESPEETAVRETCEELLVDREQIELLSAEPYLDRTGKFRIYPFTGLIRDYQDTFFSDEVDHVFTVPVKWFVDNPPEIHDVTVTSVPPDDFPFDDIPGGRDYPWRSFKDPCYFYYHEHAVIWGLTAVILHAFFEKYKEIL